MQINAENLQWSNDYKVPDFSKRKDNYFAINKILDSIEPCDFGDKIARHLDVLQRIGSDSKSAEVYLLEIKEQSSTVPLAALKVLPIFNSNSLDKNENEIRLALNASTLVLEGRSVYFPLVYFFDECMETIFQSKEFNTKSREYQNRINPVNCVDERNTIPFVNYIDWSVNTPVKSNILISELAEEDLYVYLNKNHMNMSYEDWVKLINHCLKAIDDMHIKLNIIHNDLHLRNFLIAKSENEIIPLIHDFGSSELVNYDEIKLYSYDKLDIDFFIVSLLEFIESKNNNNSLILEKVKSYITQNINNY
jgi:hypothetical protein